MDVNPLGSGVEQCSKPENQMWNVMICKDYENPLLTHYRRSHVYLHDGFIFSQTVSCKFTWCIDLLKIWCHVKKVNANDTEDWYMN